MCLTCFVYLGQVARMLKERGRLIDAPEDSYDSNFLTRQSLSRVWEASWTLKILQQQRQATWPFDQGVTAKKTDFVYCGVEALLKSS